MCGRGGWKSKRGWRRRPGRSGEWKKEDGGGGRHVCGGLFGRGPTPEEIIKTSAATLTATSCMEGPYPDGAIRTGQWIPQRLGPRKWSAKVDEAETAKKKKGGREEKKKSSSPSEEVVGREEGGRKTFPSEVGGGRPLNPSSYYFCSPPPGFDDIHYDTAPARETPEKES